MKKDHQVRKFILSALAFVIVLAMVVTLASNVVKRKDSDKKYRDFFEEEQDYDIIFFGSSTVMNGIYPMELWKEYGYTSYNFGGHGNHIPVSYWIFENVLDYKTPKMVVVDVYFLDKMDKYRTDVQQMHQSLDAFRISPTKYLMIRELFTKDSMFYDNRFEFLFPFGSYHDRWTELTSDDFDPQYNTIKGAEMRVDVAISQEPSSVKKDEMDDTFTTGKAYLERWIEECQRKGIEIMLINLPRAVTDEEQEYANSAQLIADKYGINFVNYTYEDVVDYSLDFYDTDGHLNPSGARSVTKAIGEYISENYDIADHRGDASYETWRSAEESYIEEKIAVLDAQEYLETYLMLLNDEDFRCTIEIADKNIIDGEARINDLIQRLSSNNENEVITVSNIENADVESEVEPIISIEVYRKDSDELVSNAVFGHASVYKPKDESLDYVVFYANDNYIRAD